MLEAAMTVTPLSHAETPDRHRPAGPDLLSEMLKAVRLTGSVFLHARVTAPFGVVAPKYYDEQTPMAHLRHISIFHLIVARACTFETAAGECREMTAGELLFLPFADQHKFWKGEPSEMAAASDIVEHGPIEGVWTVDYGGGGEELRMVCGFIDRRNSCSCQCSGRSRHSSPSSHQRTKWAAW